MRDRPPHHLLLLDDLRSKIRARHLSLRTEQAYASWAERFIRFHRGRHPASMRAPEIDAFLTYLSARRGVAASTHNQAASALLFLYREVLGMDVERPGRVVRARTPTRLPVVLTPTEVRSVIDRMQGTNRIIATLLYGSGMRLLECMRLRVKDIDFERREILIREGKGDRDRVTMLPEAVRAELGRHLQIVRDQHDQDLESGAGWVALPFALERKYPYAGREWAWQWVFPATRIHRDDASGRRRRHFLHPSCVQRAVKEAVRRSGISKRATCHTFRHSFATHLLEAGYDIRHRARAARPPERAHHHDLHARAESWRAGRAESCGQLVRRNTTAIPAYSDLVQRHVDRSESCMTTVTVSPKYQVVIPKAVREHINLEPGQKIHVFALDNSILLVPHVPIESMRGFLKGRDLPPFEREPDREI